MYDFRNGTIFGAENKRAIKSLVNIAAMLVVLASTFGSSLPTLADEADATQPARSEDLKEQTDSGILLTLSPNGEKLGKFPLHHTTIDAKISGYVASVTVKQEFQNPYANKSNAIYSFPLSDSAAVDKMTMTVNGRVIEGKIKTKAEAREMYQKALAVGHTASLLDQSRTNVFTQSIAGIQPGDSIIITLHYEEILSFESGQFTFAFPLGAGRAQSKHSGTDKHRHDLSINVDVDAGISVFDVHSNIDGIDTHINDGHRIVASLFKKEISTKDFLLSWKVSNDQISSGYLSHKNPLSNSGFFTLMVMPPNKLSQQQISPKELIFLVDCSGSQIGDPLNKAKKTLKYIVAHMNPNDTFQVIAFKEKQECLFERPERLSPDSQARSQKFIDSLEGHENKGPWNTSAVERALAMPNDAQRLKIVAFMTDGYMGYDQEVIGLIHKYRNSVRWFPFGVDFWVNRPFIRSIAREGGGEPEFVPSDSSAEEVATRFYSRISAPVLTQVKVDFGDLKVTDVFPRETGDVWAQRPLYFQGRYTQPGAGIVTISGNAAGKPYKETLNVILPDNQPKNAVLAPLWAKAKVEVLVSENYLAGLVNRPGYEASGGGGWTPPNNFRAESLHGFASVAPEGIVNDNLKNEITNLGLQNHIMTNYTSYVAVDEQRATQGHANGSLQVTGGNPDAVEERDPAFAPTLQGATNGTIGPQGADATFVDGINTAGSVRANSLANVEALLNILSNLSEWLGILIGLKFAISGLLGHRSRKFNGRTQLVVGLLLIASGVALPMVVNYLIGFARDANLFG